MSKVLDAAIQKHLPLKVGFEDVKLLSDYPSTRVPLDEFRSDDAASVYRLTFGDNSLDGLSIRYEVLPSLDVVEVFPVNPDVEKTVLNYFPDATVHSIYGQSIMVAFREERRKVQQNEDRRLYVSIEGGELFLFTFEEGHLTFANSYSALQLSSQLYFILYAWGQLKLDQQKDECVLMGENKELKQELAKYIRNITCA